MSSIIASDQQIIRSNPQLYTGVKPSDITASYVLTTFFVDLVVFFLLFITLLTVAGGTLGSFLGRRRARIEAASAQADVVVTSAHDEVSTDEAMR
jgi:uncharacterized SAM-binding protein YcdF (DUF218 family)